MKKYFLLLTFLFSFFFLGVSTSLVSAEGSMKYEIKASDSYDNRKVTITLSQYYNYLFGIKITELDLCAPGDTTCVVYERAKTLDNKVDYSTTPLKVVKEEVYPINLAEYRGNPIDLDYTLKTERDGTVYLLIEALYEDNSLAHDTGSYTFALYELSTLNQRIKINPDAEGVPSNTIEGVQYTAARNNAISITLFDSEYTNYTGEVYICESGVVGCIKYTIRDEALNYSIRSYGDGEKKLDFYLARKNKEIKNDEFTEDNSVKISKKIYLDTVGPKIKIEGGQWIFVESGKRYKQQEATCSDAVFPSPKYKCTVNNDLDIVRIDYTKDAYQLITYSAVDELGNISNVVVKIKVEIAENDNSGLIAIIISGVVVLVTFSILGVVVYKNNQKKKKLSYI